VAAFHPANPARTIVLMILCISAVTLSGELLIEVQQLHFPLIEP
jgi:hypothetical protein